MLEKFRIVTTDYDDFWISLILTADFNDSADIANFKN